MEPEVSIKQIRSCIILLLMTSLGDVLMQDRIVIAYDLRQLKPHKKNFPTHDFDLLAIIFALKIQRNYIYCLKCEVFMDYHNLQHVFTQKDLNLMQRRWMELLKYYDIKIQYNPSKPTMVEESSKYGQVGRFEDVKMTLG